MQTAIERLTDELEQARRELRAAQSRTSKLERALTRAARDAAATRRRRDAQQQRLEAFNN
jgi:septal ring factor EnvC (AmiA/AmiB activator)